MKGTDIDKFCAINKGRDFAIWVAILLILFQCKPSAVMPNETTKIVRYPIVEKMVFNQNGENTGLKGYYLQQSMKDYYIKICESEVTQEEIKKALDKQSGLIKALTLEVIYREGNLDQCDDHEVAGRIGDYVIIKSIR